MKLLIPKNLKTLIKHNLKSCKREKEIKHEKSEKYVLAYKMQCFVRVAMLEKIRERPGKIIKILIEFSSNFNPNSSKHTYSRPAKTSSSSKTPLNFSWNLSPVASLE